MPSYQCPRSLVAQFPEEVYKNAGASDVLPLVMKSLDADKVLAVQFLRAGRVRLTFQDPETCAQVLKEGLDLGDVSVQLLPADDRLCTVHLRYLPVEIGEEVVSSFLTEFGEVLSVSHCFFDDYPTVRNGNRVAKILLDRDIPQFVEVDRCNCRVWYLRQPAQCSVCREFGHRAPACPLSGRCRRCHQPGHMARECTQAWGPSLSAPRTADHSIETEEVPVTIVSVSNVTKTSSSVTPAASATSATSAVTNTSSSVTTARSTAAASTSSSTVTVTTIPSSPAAVATVPSILPSSPVSTASVSKPTSPRPLLSSKVFLSRLMNRPQVEVPHFEDNFKFKAYIKQQVKRMLESKELGAKSEDLLEWTRDEIFDICNVFCDKFSMPYDFFGLCS